MKPWKKSKQLDHNVQRILLAALRQRGRSFRDVDVRPAAQELGRFAASAIGATWSRVGGAMGPIGVLDLFSGCGGLSLGFEFIGQLVPSYRLLGAADVDVLANQTYAANLPIIPQETDLLRVAEKRASIRAFGRQMRVPDGRAPWILVGGPPCQGFSSHRKRDGVVRDRRDHLINAFGRLAAELQPDILVMENVPELLSSAHWQRFLRFKAPLEARGYTVRTAIHSLAGYGVPQARFRALVIASRKPIGLPRPFLDVHHYRTVRDAISHLPTLQAGERCSRDPMHVCTKHRDSTLAIIRRVPHDGGRRPRGVGPRCLQEVDGFRDVYGRMHWDRPANTITAYSRNPASGRYVHPEQDRGLTIREAALLQGFPQRFDFLGPFDHRFQQIGNAVPPIFSAYLAAHLLGELLASSAPDQGEDDNEITGPLRKSFSSGIAARKRANVLAE